MARLARYDGQYLFDVRGRARSRTRAAAAAASPAGRRGARRVCASPSCARRRPTTPGRRSTRRCKLDPDDLDAHYVAGQARGAPSRTSTGKRSTCARSRRRAATATRSRWRSPSVAEARKDTAGAARRARGGAPLRSDAGRSAARASTSSRRRDKRDADALAALREVARLDQHDRARVGLLLGDAGRRQALGRGEATSASRRIYVDVESAAVHVDYARALAGDGRPRGGVLRARERAPVRREAAGARRSPSRCWRASDSPSATSRGHARAATRRSSSIRPAPRPCAEAVTPCARSEAHARDGPEP